MLRWWRSVQADAPGNARKRLRPQSYFQKIFDDEVEPMGLIDLFIRRLRKHYELEELQVNWVSVCALLRQLPWLGYLPQFVRGWAGGSQTRGCRDVLAA